MIEEFLSVLFLYDGKDVIDVAFPYFYFVLVCGDGFGFERLHENFCDDGGHWCSHGFSVGLGVE